LTVQRTSWTGRVTLTLAGLIFLGLASLPLWADTSTARRLVTLLTLIALAQMWNLLAGYAGMVSVGQQAYVGLGAYGFWFFTDQMGIHPFGSVFLAMVVAGIISVPTAFLVFRLRGGYFAIGTWVMAEIFRLIVSNVPQSGGGSGQTVGGASRLVADTRMYGTYLLALLAAAGAVLVVYFLLRSRLGLGLTSIRDNEIAAESLGVRIFRSKLYVYVIAALGAGFAGAVIYLNLIRIQPDAAFSINWTAFVIFIVIIGGVGTVEGPILGAIIYYVLQETLSEYGTYYLILLGVVAIAITVWSPGGLWGFVQRQWGLQLFPVQRRLLVPAGAAGPPPPPADCTPEELFEERLPMSASNPASAGESADAAASPERA
jgi:branched-chain amino acid transport system permease protein